MSRLLVLATLLIPASAAADGTAAPAVCASCVVAPAPKPADMQHRLGVSARAVSLSLDDGTTKSEYGGGGLAVSYRLSRRWELALSVDALDAPEGPDLHSSMLSARFHLTPHRQWDWYAIAGIGGLHEVPLEGESHDGVARGQFQLGAGLARRFPRWSIAAELHAVGVGPREEEMSTAQKAVTTPMATDEGLSGGQFTVAATFFF